MMFHDLNLHPGILEAIAELGHTTPTPIQQQAIPKILEGLDLRASAQTGTGKTAAFLLPILHLLTKPSALKGFGPRALILVPTRELAIQVAKECGKYGKNLARMKTVCIYGGAPYPVQNRELSRPYEILVATPGRLIDHLERGRIDFSRLEVMVLDEADRMLDMGFIEPVESIAAATPETRQTLMFSATLKGSVMKLSERLLKHPIEVSVAAQHAKHDHIEQRLHFVDNLDHKHRLLDHLLNEPSVVQAIVFTSTKNHADVLLDMLLDNGHRAAALHGDMNQRQRERTLSRLKSGEQNLKILVATDVAARGIDVLTISHVINFDLPMSAEDYVHRIGRTGRAGGKGIAFSFATYKEMHVVKRIEQFTGQKIPPHVVEGLEPQSKPAPSSSSSRPSDGRRRFPARRGGGGFKSGGPREGGFKREGGFGQEGGSREGGPREGGFKREGGFRKEGGYRQEGGPREGGFKREGGPREGGYRQEGGSREGGYRQEGGPREGGFKREGGSREGGYRQEGGSREGGYRQEGGSREGGYRQEGGFRKEGGFKSGSGFKQGGSSRPEGGFRKEGGFKGGFKQDGFKQRRPKPASKNFDRTV